MMNSNHKGILKNWRLLTEGDKQGLYNCFNLFYDDLYRFGMALYHNSELIKESIQNLFIELWNIRYKLTEIENVQQYVFTIFKRIIYKTHLKLFPKKSIEEYQPEELKSPHISVSCYEAILIASQEDDFNRKRLQHALKNLSIRQKEIIQLRYFDSLSFKEIASKTLLTERTVYNTLHNAIKVLRDTLMLLLFFI